MTTEKEKRNNAIVQALCQRKLQGKAQALFVAACLPEVDIADLQRKIADLQGDLESFSRDLAQIDADYSRE